MPKLHRYAELDLSFRLGAKEYTVRSITSQYGAIRILDYDRAMQAHGDILGQVVSVNVNGALTLPMYFTKEFNRDGRYFNLKFCHLGSIDRISVIELINENGIDDLPWQRKHPRLDAISFQGQMIVPSVAIIHFADTKEVYRVLNFTVDGCLVEASNPSFIPLELGIPILFDLRINNGEELNQINGRVMRISLEKLPEMDHKLLSLGIKIAHMASSDFDKYRAMIRNYCEILRS